jgi:hypothetical protein
MWKKDIASEKEEMGGVKWSAGRDWKEFNKKDI